MKLVEADGCGRSNTLSSLDNFFALKCIFPSKLMLRNQRIQVSFHYFLIIARNRLEKELMKVKVYFVLIFRDLVDHHVTILMQ